MNETIKTLMERKSTKSFTGEHITREEIDIIVEAGLKAPSGLNKQTPRFVVVTDDAVVERLSKLNAELRGMTGDPFYNAKDVIVVLVKKEGCYIYDGGVAFGNLLNASYSIGVGACWIHHAKAVFESEKGKELLKEWGIEEDVEGIGFCVLGRELKEKPIAEIKPGRVLYI